MKIKVRTAGSGPEHLFRAGDIINVTEEFGQVMIKNGYAEEVKDPEKPKVKAVEPESAAVEPQEETAVMPPPRKRRKKANARM